MGNPEEGQDIQAAHDMVERMLDTLSAHLRAPERQSTPVEVSRRLAKAMMAGLSTDVAPFLTAWGELADRYPGTHLEFGFRELAHASSTFAEPPSRQPLEQLEAALSRIKGDLAGSALFLRRAENDTNPRTQAPRITDTEQAIRIARDAVARAWRRLSTSEEILRLADLGAAEHSAAERALLEHTMSELETNLAPVIATWTALAHRSPARLASDETSRTLGTALHRYRDAEWEAAQPFTPYSIDQIESKLAQVKGYIETCGYWHPTETEEPPPRRRTLPSGRIGSRPPGPRFVDDDDDSTRRGTPPAAVRPAPPGAPAGPRPPGPRFAGDDDQARRAEAPHIASPGPAARTAEPPRPHTSPAHGIPGPYDDVREPWHRRLLRRRKGPK